MPRNSILSWLNDISAANSSTAITSNQSQFNEKRRSKRRRLERPLTPEDSQTTTNECMNRNDDAEDPTKHSWKQRTGKDASEDDEDDHHRLDPVDLDQTPRPSLKTAGGGRLKRKQSDISDKAISSDIVSSRATSSTGETGSTSGSQRSGKRSPRKHLHALRHHPRGVIFRDKGLLLSSNRTPGLAALLRAVSDISDGLGILSGSSRADFTRACEQLDANEFSWAVRDASREVRFSTSERDDLGYTPSPATVLDVFGAATECSQRRHPEATWNLEVHQKLLGAALRPPEQPPFSRLVNFMGCTTASIMPEYAVSDTRKKFDFCIYIEPGNEIPGGCSRLSQSELLPIQKAIQYLSVKLTGGIFGHTEHEPLENRPIAVSIETKKMGEGWEGATLQMGVWLNAHWAFLRLLTDAAVNKVRQTQPSADGGTRENIKLPEFLPGIIIQGHDWHLIVTTPNGQQIDFWQKWTIGSTSSTRGIYQIICTLQLLRRWAEETYWPWLRSLISNLASR